jgi:hypothetical protein
MLVCEWRVELNLNDSNVEIMMFAELRDFSFVNHDSDEAAAQAGHRDCQWQSESPTHWQIEELELLRPSHGVDLIRISRSLRARGSAYEDCFRLASGDFLLIPLALKPSESTLISFTRFQVVST